MARYRIVKDVWLGYEVRVWRWWFPFWVQACWSNTHSSIEDAEEFARAHATVIDLGELPCRSKST